MKPAHETFMYQMLLHGDKIAAYKTAYPTASENSIRSAANRLLQDPDIGGVIERKRQELRAEMEAEIRAEMKVELAAEMEYKIMLSQIIRREIKIERQVKGANNESMTLYSDPGFAQMIRAGLVLGAMEGWNMGSAKGGERRAKEEKEEESERKWPARETLKERLRRMELAEESARDIWVGSKDDPEYLALSSEEQDTLRRRGGFHECSYKCVQSIIRR